MTTALLATIKTAYERAVENHELREALRVSVSIIAERDKAVHRLEDQNIHLRAQLRAMMTGRTIAAERLDRERELLDAADDQQRAA